MPRTTKKSSAPSANDSSANGVPANKIPYPAPPAETDPALDALVREIIGRVATDHAS